MKHSSLLKNKPKLTLSLYREGLRQLRVGGIVYVIICALFSLGNMIDRVGDEDIVMEHKVIMDQNIKVFFEDSLIFATICVIVFTVLASFYVMNFLRSGKARDFYCATPHTLGSIWLSFAGAVYTWAAAGVAAISLVQLPVMLYIDVRSIGVWLVVLLSMLSFAVMACGIVMLAVTMTGRLIPGVVTAYAIAILPSSLWEAFHTAYHNYFQYFHVLYFPKNVPYLDPLTYFLSDFGYFESMLAGSRTQSTTALFCSPVTIGFCLVTGLVYLAASALFMQVRTGDAVGKPFVNKTAHLLALTIGTVDISCMASVAFMDLLSDQRLFGYGFHSMPLVLVVLVAGVALGYWLLELVLTFRIRQSWRVLPFLPVPILLVALMTGGGWMYYHHEMVRHPKADEVASFTLVRNPTLSDELAVFRMNDTKGRLMTDEAEIEDETVIRCVTRYLDSYAALYERDEKQALRQSSDYINIRLNLKNGGSIIRSVMLTDELETAIARALQQDSAFMKRFLALPDADDVNLSNNLYGLTDAEMVQLYNSFRAEYNALPDAQKLAYLKHTLYYADDEVIALDDTDKVYMEDGEVFVDGNEPVTLTDLRPVCDVIPSGFVASRMEYTPSIHTSSIVFYLTGYAEGRLYDPEQYYTQSYSLHSRLFPKTRALAVQLVNGKLSDVQDMMEHRLKEDSRLMMFGNYITPDGELDISYSYVNQVYVLDYEAYKNGRYDSEEEYLDDDGNPMRTVKVDANVLVKKLMEDAAASPAQIDLSKPYCRLDVFFSEKDDMYNERWTLFIQTDSPMDFVEGLKVQ